MVPLTRRSRRPKHPVVNYTFADTDLGRLIIAATDQGVCFLSLGDDDASLEADMRETVRADEFRQVGSAALAIGPYLAQVLRFLQGDSDRLDVRIDVQGTEFQLEVWQALSQIPYGQTVSYTDIAEAVGRPQSVRSVAQACGANPVPLIVPCHRVVAKDGLGGFGLGLERKRALLELEQRIAKHGQVS